MCSIPRATCKKPATTWVTGFSTTSRCFLRTHELTSLDLANHIDAALVTAALELAGEPGVDDHLGQLDAHHTSTKCEHVGVVVLA